jgi:hypothetical protein
MQWPQKYAMSGAIAATGARGDHASRERAEGGAPRAHLFLSPGVPRTAPFTANPEETMSANTFCTAINCMDGRTQQTVNDYLRAHFRCAWVDVITEPGPVRILSEQRPRELVDSIIERLKISVGKHGSRGVGVVAHHDCAGNPLDRAAQLEQLQDAVAYIKMHAPGLAVLALWVNERWETELIR